MAKLGEHGPRLLPLDGGECRNVEELHEERPVVKLSQHWYCLLVVHLSQVVQQLQRQCKE